MNWTLVIAAVGLAIAAIYIARQPTPMPEPTSGMGGLTGGQPLYGRSQGVVFPIEGNRTEGSYTIGVKL